MKSPRTPQMPAPRLDDIIRLSVVILNLDPCDIESMLIIAHHREHPYVKLPLTDAIAMMEWAREIEPDNVYVACIIERLYLETCRYETN
jgi:hypothetical protein